MNKLMIGTLKKHEQSKNKVFLCPELSSDLKAGNTIKLHYGQTSTEAVVSLIKSNDVVGISANLWATLSIPFPHKVHLSIDVRNNSLFLGPLVGIFTTATYPDPISPCGKRTGFYQRYISSQEDVPVSYFLFGPKDISIATGRINGYFLVNDRGSMRWERHQVPFPNVIYNRVFRYGEKLRSIIKLKAILQSNGVKMFNPFCFNKWDIHQRIHQDEAIQPYIPTTILNPSSEQLIQLLRKYRLVYLKPEAGYLGLGIVKMYYKNQLKKFTSISSATRHLFGSRGLEGYIAQQGIRLIQLNDRTIDFRVHTNKDRFNNWKMTAAAAKMAGKGSVTTHIRTGGQVYPYKEVIQNFFPSDKKEKVLKDLEKAVIALSTSIEKNLPDHVGDIGFDIGIDENGHPWMFEANSQPGRHVFSLKGMKEREILTRNMILDYALYLSNFTSASTSKEVKT
jgi:hypothetical protein